MILIVPDFLSTDKCAELITIMNYTAGLGVGQKWAHRHEIHAWEMPPEARVLIHDFRQRATELMNRYFDSGVAMEYCVMNTNLAGDSIVPHCDNCADDGGPNHTPWRTHTCNLYFGGDYSGGMFSFPDLDIELRPQPGTLLAFPAGRGFRHMVDPIESGARYSALTWFTSDPARFMRSLY